MTPHRIMIVEDERIVALNMAVELRALGYEVVSVESSGEDAVARAHETSPDLILMDIMLDGEMDGIDAAKAIRSRSDIPVVYLTAYSDDRLLLRAKESVPAGYLIKPVAARAVHASIQIALYLTEIEKRSKQAKARSGSGLEPSTQLPPPYWPGNARELRDEIRKALTECALNIEFGGRTLRDVTDHVTRSMCWDAVQRCNGNKKEAAKLLGISRDSLYRFLREFGMLTKDHD